MAPALSKIKQRRRVGGYINPAVLFLILQRERLPPLHPLYNAHVTFLCFPLAFSAFQSTHSSSRASDQPVSRSLSIPFPSIIHSRPPPSPPYLLFFFRLRDYPFSLYFPRYNLVFDIKELEVTLGGSRKTEVATMVEMIWHVFFNWILPERVIFDERGDGFCHINSQ